MAELSYEELVATVRNKFKDADVSAIAGKLAYQFNVTGSAEGIFYVEIKDQKVNIEPYEYYDRNAIITMDGEDLVKMINGGLDPIKAFTTGRLKVDGDINAALELIRFIK